MRFSKFFSAVFAVLGTILMTGTVALCLLNLNSEPKLEALPKAASECAEAMMQALADGDFAAAGKLMYGQPDLGAAGSPQDETGALVWDAFVGRISFAFSGECYVVDSQICRDVTVTVLDVNSVTAALPELARTLLTREVEAAEEPETLYDENGEFRAGVVDAVLQEAAVQALAQAQTKTYQVTLQLISREGQWWVIPDQALLDAISGGAA